MSTADRSQLLRVLQGHRDAVVDSWYKALTRTDSFVPLKAAEVRQHLVGLTDQAIALLLAEPFERGKAQAIGAALVRLRCVQPEALGRTQEILAHRLVEGLPAEQVVALQPRLAALLGGLAAGFFQQARETILAEQEQIRSALIAELRRAQESLRESEQTAWALLNAPADVALLLEPDGTVVALNEAAAKSLGKSLDELVDACVLDLFPPDVAECRRAQVNQVILSGQPVRFEDEREGRWFASSVYPVLDAQGKVVRLAVLAHDITERKRAEEALRESEELVRVLLNAPTDSALLLDLDGTIVALNEAAAERLGRAASELVGTCAFDLFPPQVAELRRNQGRRLLRSGKPARFEDEREGRWFDQSAYPVFDAQGKAVRFAVIARDITERKKAEKALRDHVEQLSILREIDSVTLAARSPEEVARTVIGYLRQQIPCLGASAVLFDFEAREGVVLVADVTGKSMGGGWNALFAGCAHRCRESY